MVATHTVYRALLTSLFCSLLMLGCAATKPIVSEPPESKVWPEPPAPPRIRFVRSFHAAEDLGIEKSFWKRLGEFITGAETTFMVRPMAVTTDARGDRIYVADPGVRGVHRFDTAGGDYKLLRRKDNLPLPSPVGIALGADNRIYVTDSMLGRLFKLDPGDKYFSPVQLEVQLKQPTGIAAEPETGKLYIVDTAAHGIKVFSARGALVAQFGSRGTGPLEFNFPTSVWIDGHGHLLVTDSLNFRIQIMDMQGNFVGQFGRLGDASGRLARPKGVATDSFGHIYVVDSVHHALQTFDTNGSLLLALGEQGRDAGQFWLPTGLFIAPDNLIYVSDSRNQRVQLFRYIGGGL